MTDIAPVLEKLVQYLEHPTVPVQREWWSAEEVAVYLGVKPRTVSERYRFLNGFPEVKRLPSESGLGSLRWKAKEIRQWMERQG